MEVSSWSKRTPCNHHMQRESTKKKACLWFCHFFRLSAKSCIVNWYAMLSLSCIPILVLSAIFRRYCIRVMCVILTLLIFRIIMYILWYVGTCRIQLIVEFLCCKLMGHLKRGWSKPFFLRSDYPSPFRYAQIDQRARYWNHADSSRIVTLTIGMTISVLGAVWSKVNNHIFDIIFADHDTDSDRFWFFALSKMGPENCLAQLSRLGCTPSWYPGMGESTEALRLLSDRKS